MASGLRLGAMMLCTDAMLGPSIAGAQTISGLSDNSDCVEAVAIGTVTSRNLISKNKEIEGFRFKDSYGDSYINVSLPEAMPRKTKLATHAKLLKTIKAGAKLILGVQACEASGRIQVLSSVAPG